MRDFRDAKAMAQTLREALNAKSVSLPHSESQELIAKILGFRDWNVLAARIQASQPTATESGTPVPGRTGSRSVQVKHSGQTVSARPLAPRDQPQRVAASATWFRRNFAKKLWQEGDAPGSNARSPGHWWRSR
jgi:hypothetical protein